MKPTGQLIASLIEQVQRDLAGFSIRAFFWNPNAGAYQTALPENQTPAIERIFEDGLPAALRGHQGVENLRVGQNSAYFLVRVPDKLFGWVEATTVQDIDPEALTDFQRAESNIWQIRIDLVQAFTSNELERKTNEIEILSRIAQGINITVQIDDILELVYAQTCQLMPIESFRVLTRTEVEGQYTYPFFVEHDERITQRENKPGTSADDPEITVALTRKPYISHDDAKGRSYTNFLAVPLNSGADTIGCLAVANSDPHSKYTRAHQDYLQSIADQTASAILRSKLMRQMEQRNTKLSQLNQAAEQLNQSLSPNLLPPLILQFALGLIDGSKGKLWVSEDGHWMVAAETSPDPLEQSRVHSITLESGQTIIGRLEIEVQNSPYLVEAEHKLLAAFANQAATALANARLYALTDQKLANRVEELSIMQQIDLELNQKIDIAHSLRTTLKWAIQFSGLHTGACGLWADNKMVYTQLAGIGEEQGGSFIDELGDWLAHPNENQSPVVVLNSSDATIPTRTGVQPNHQLQVRCRILRDGSTIGILALAGDNLAKPQQELVAFLARLCDHAVIAITNGMLFNQISDANLAKSEFVSFVAHELKNPMTSIKGYTELMSAGAVGQLTDPQKSFLNTIHANVERMRTIVDDLNDISKIEAGRMRLEPKSVLIKTIFENVLASTKRQISDKKQSVQLDLPDQFGELFVDQTRTEQIFINLVGNSNKYTPEGGSITITAKPDGQTVGHLVISISDNGIGMSQEDQKMVFSKFFRSEDDRARKATGAGLGLNITKNLVEMQGGKIWFTSAINQGSTFYVSLPTMAGSIAPKI